MLPTTLVTFATFLLEICSSSPVYNMQPAFITNTVGATTGRNIRNLPCISRRNSNQSGFCMFAIDCLKANGTHLGTCIDGFYFGSCCHIEPVRDIIDNSIDTDIIPHREPPFRISSTTMKTTGPSKNDSTTLKTNLSGTKTTTVSSVTPKLTTIRTSSEKTTIPQTTPSSTTTAQKLQTFQVVQEVTTKSSVLSTTNRSVEISSISLTKTPVTKEPVPSVPTKITTVALNTTTRPANTSFVTPHFSTTEKIQLTTSNKFNTSSVSTRKPTISTKLPSSTTSSKPTKVSTKPSKLMTTTKKPDLVPTKSQLTTKPTKKTGTSTKPTKKTTVTTSTSNLITTTSNLTTTTEKLITKRPVDTSTINYYSTSKPHITTLSANTSSKLPVSLVAATPTTPTPDNFTKTNEVNGNKTTTEMEGPTTIPPGLITWTVVDNRNATTAIPEIPTINVTTEDWIPITTPDGWVLLSNAGSNVNQTVTPSVSTQPLPQETSSPSSISLDSNTTISSTTSKTSEAPVVDVSVVELNTTVDVTSSSTSSYVTSENEVSSSSESSTDGTIIPIERPVNMSDFTDVCGRRMHPEARIVGGEKSSFGKWPWQISLRQWRTSTYLHKCGAALLNENWAITAAHCVDNVPPSDLLLRLGEHDLSTESEPYLHQERRVQIVASHPQFDPRTFEYDLALLRFYEPVNFQPNILPVCVPQTDENFVGRTAHVTGWGRLYEDGPLPSILQEVSVPVINNTVCESMYRAAGYIEHIPHIFICAGWRRGGFDSCEGDSGGPMVIQRQDKRFLLAGVISWGIGCAEPNQPGVYTRISEFRDWINQILQF